MGGLKKETNECKSLESIRVPKLTIEGLDMKIGT